jgi:hypothetical protein
MGRTVAPGPLHPVSAVLTGLVEASDAARYVTGQQLRIDAGGALKAIPWSG